MTYCVGIGVREGLVFAADTRTSAAFDDVRVHSKMHVFDYPGKRSFVLMTSGNLATSQAVVAQIRRDLDDPDAAFSLLKAKDLFAAADYVGRLLVASQAQIAEIAKEGSVSVQSTLILGGQIAGDEPALLLIYPLGNCIEASPETPYLQLGESKYGKPILDRIVRPDTSLEDAARCALVSIDSTIRSNVSVGLPIDLVLIRNGSLHVSERMRLDRDTPLYAEIHDSWSKKLEAAVRSLPRFPWETTSESTPIAAVGAQHQQ